MAVEDENVPLTERNEDQNGDDAENHSIATEISEPPPGSGQQAQPDSPSGSIFRPCRGTNPRRNQG